MLASAPVLLLAWNNYLVGGLTLVFLIVCVVMLLTILIQKPQGGGLTAAFGAGASSGQTAFGAKTGDALTIFTIFIFVVYLVLAVVLNWAAKPTVAAVEPEIIDSTPAGPQSVPPADSGAPLSSPADPASGLEVVPATELAVPPAAPATVPGDPLTPTNTPDFDPAVPPSPPSADPAPPGR